MPGNVAAKNDPKTGQASDALLDDILGELDGSTGPPGTSRYPPFFPSLPLLFSLQHENLLEHLYDSSILMQAISAVLILNKICVPLDCQEHDKMQAW